MATDRTAAPEHASPSPRFPRFATCIRVSSATKRDDAGHGATRGVTSESSRFCIIQYGRKQVPSSAQNSMTPQWDVFGNLGLRISKTIGYWMWSCVRRFRAEGGRTTCAEMARVASAIARKLPASPGRCPAPHLVAVLELRLVDEGHGKDAILCLEGAPRIGPRAEERPEHGHRSPATRSRRRTTKTDAKKEAFPAECAGVGVGDQPLIKCESRTAVWWLLHSSPSPMPFTDGQRSDCDRLRSFMSGKDRTRAKAVRQAGLADFGRRR